MESHDFVTSNHFDLGKGAPRRFTKEEWERMMRYKPRQMFVSQTLHRFYKLLIELDKKGRA